MSGAVRIRPERPADVDPIRAVTAAAFAGIPRSAPPVEPGGPPGEATLVDLLRADPGWIPALGLGPVSVLPDRQGTGVGSALVRALLDAAARRDERLVALLGDPGYYARFGFQPTTALGVAAPDPAWGDYFQAVALPGRETPRGTFRYAAPFDSL